jgi:hypothetical protein
MTKVKKTVGLSASLALCAAAMALAVPMDMEAARKLPAIRALVEKVKAGSTLTPANEEQLYAQLQSADPVLASLSAWALGETKNANHTTRISAAQHNLSGPAAAFATIAMAKLSSDWQARRNEKLKGFLSDENLYLRVEAARELIPFDVGAATDALQKILNDPASPCKTDAALVLDESGKSHAPMVPVEDDPYETILEILHPQDAFKSHQLTGKSGGQTFSSSPFPRGIERFLWTWELKANSSADAVEIRWLAADVSSVDKNHLVAKAKSDTNQTKGEFTLKRPTTGFPTGEYRVEVWQSGKMIYSEKFEIKPD